MSARQDWTPALVPAHVGDGSGFSADVFVERTFTYVDRSTINKPILGDRNAELLDQLLAERGQEQALRIHTALGLDLGNPIEPLHRIVDVRFYKIDR